MQKWEYQVVIRYLDPKTGKYNWEDPNEMRNGEEVLNALGQKGWELISVLPISKDWQTNLSGNTSHIHYFLKRPI